VNDNKTNLEEIKIRKIDNCRWSEFQALRLEALKTVPEAFGSSYEDEYSFQEEVWSSRMPNMLFAIYRDSIIGMVGLKIRIRPKTKHIADIFSFYVSEKYQGNGVGSKLMEEAIHLIRKNPEVRKVSLSVCCAMEPAIHLCRNFGFLVSGTLVKELNVNVKFYDEFIMEKVLW